MGGEWRAVAKREQRNSQRRTGKQQRATATSERPGGGDTARGPHLAADLDTKVALQPERRLEHGTVLVGEKEELPREQPGARRAGSCLVDVAAAASRQSRPKNLLDEAAESRELDLVAGVLGNQYVIHEGDERRALQRAKVPVAHHEVLEGDLGNAAHICDLEASLRHGRGRHVEAPEQVENTGDLVLGVEQ